MLAVSRFSRTLRRCSRAACRSSRRWRSSRTSSTTRKLEKVVETAAGIDPRRRVDRRAAQAQRRFPADRDAHDRGRREERPARADARERREGLRHAGRDARAGADEPARAAHDRLHGRRRRLHRLLDPDAAHPDERLRADEEDPMVPRATRTEGLLPVGAAAGRALAARARARAPGPARRRAVVVVVRASWPARSAAAAVRATRATITTASARSPAYRADHAGRARSRWPTSSPAATCARCRSTRGVARCAWSARAARIRAVSISRATVPTASPAGSIAWSEEGKQEMP